MSLPMVKKKKKKKSTYSASADNDRVYTMLMPMAKEYVQCRWQMSTYITNFNGEGIRMMSIRIVTGYEQYQCRWWKKYEQCQGRWWKVCTVPMPIMKGYVRFLVRWCFKPSQPQYVRYQCRWRKSAYNTSESGKRVHTTLVPMVRP